MKKIMLGLFMMIAIIGNVSAATNQLYFSETGNRLYYDSDLFDGNKFMVHEDMIPGREYTDTLTIKNGTGTEYDLYLKAIEVEESNELLDHIIMTIYLDGEVIYDGYARGINYKDDETGKNLQDAIYIGKYQKDKTSELVVKTMLEPDYVFSTVVESKINWEFYANYEIIIPNTGDDINKYRIQAIASIIAILVIGILVYIRKKENSKGEQF